MQLTLTTCTVDSRRWERPWKRGTRIWPSSTSIQICRTTQEWLLRNTRLESSRGDSPQQRNPSPFPRKSGLTRCRMWCLERKITFGVHVECQRNNLSATPVTSERLSSRSSFLWMRNATQCTSVAANWPKMRHSAMELPAWRWQRKAVALGRNMRWKI